MAHFAEIDSNGIVLRILVVPNEQENRGQDFLAKDLNLGGRWVQTSYNAKFRKNYAAIGYRYDESRDAFIAPQPYLSWVFNEDTCDWEAPIAYPDDEKLYYWNEPTKEWMTNE